MATPYLGEITIFGGTFAPVGWAMCDGQVLSIAQNTALFAILGTTYGGNGTTNFALPDLRGRVPIHQGQGPGLSNSVIGQAGGTETVTLLSTQIPAHSHTLSVPAGGTAGSADPTGRMPSQPSSGRNYATSGGARMAASSASAATDAAGGSQPHENRMPYLGIRFIICVNGNFPSRN